MNHTKNPIDLGNVLSRDQTQLTGVPDGYDAKVIADLAQLASTQGKQNILVVAHDGNRAAELQTAIRYFAPGLEILSFPAWDCMPYDRVSPHPAIVAQRMATLSRLSAPDGVTGARIVITTVNAALQRVPSREMIQAGAMTLAAGNRINMDRILAWLEGHGFFRSATVREAGEYAVRGGILDLYPAGQPEPLRLDFFGDTLESIRRFDPETQRTIGQQPRLELVATSELILDPEAIGRFRVAYVELFGAAKRDDLLYQSVTEGRRTAGVEHWLPLFGEQMSTIFDFVESAPLVTDHLVEEAVKQRLTDINDHYRARVEALEVSIAGQGAPYNPLLPESLYIPSDEWAADAARSPRMSISPFVGASADAIDLGGRQGRSFAAERGTEGANVFDALIKHAQAGLGAGKRVVVACWSDGSRDRMAQVLVDRGLTQLRTCGRWEEVRSVPKGTVALTTLPLETGFETADILFIGEQDVLGDRLVRPRRKSKGADYLREVNSLAPGDLVVHVDHGIGRFAGLATIEAAGAPHDCLELHYSGGDRLYLPVENIDLLTRYGSEDAEAQLDKLGGVAWQGRRARMKKRIRDMAGALIKIAAARMLRKAPDVAPIEGLYDEFATRFPFEETDDQLAAIDAVLEDLGSGRPMDRLICGDVGFGKTEVALRAAFVAALNGLQVAVVVPTTLLARQHMKTFTQRFAGFPVRIAQASRLVGARELEAVKSGITDGSVDIVIGTHALLGNAMSFHNLGLLIIDEEQHFGVKHKERLKEIRAGVHVLTLSATPIPRTLQLALSGVRELSMITTPPIDRLAVRTFVSPFDPLVVREALLRERYRGGQSFYVCPRIADLAAAKAFLDEHVPEVKVAVAHGQMASGQLDDIMSAFYDGAYDVLLSTTIIESGLDIPTANTLVVHRADRFGLGQLYQLRGRVGRSKARAYALFTVPPDRVLTSNAERRLKVLQSLDSLGAGFQLASHDLDIRGAGNLLGEEQSGHIKEVGYELYQQMLEEAVAALRDGDDTAIEGHWSPQITIGTPVMIPESYVPSLQLRMTLYRRLAEIDDVVAIDAFGAELIDRFGALPNEVEHLLKVLVIKALCRKANIEKIDTGPKGAVISIRSNRFANPGGLVAWISEQGSLAKLRPDQKIVLIRDWASAEQRLAGAAVILSQLARLAEQGDKQADEARNHLETAGNSH